MTVAAATLSGELSRISRAAREYPAYLLSGAQSGLCVFSAAFMGVNDAIHYARKGIPTTCVDVDGARLELMRDAYPDDWRFVEADAFEFVERAAADGWQWDAVSVDPFLGDAENRVRREWPLFLELARNVATITIPRMLPAIGTIDGWRISTIPRSPSASWLVAVRD